MLRLSYCNETLAGEGMSFYDQCRTLADLGYAGIEVAPGSLARDPLAMSVKQATEFGEDAARAGIKVIGMHWLLSALPHLSITDPEKSTETRDALAHLIELNAAMGGDVLVHGSPKQRTFELLDRETAKQNAIDLFRFAAERAAEVGAIYCVEPLDRSQTGFINTVEEAAEIVDRVDHPNFKTMIDTSSSGVAERLQVRELIQRWATSGYIGHIHLNDTNRGVPGSGSDPFDEIIRAIYASEWSGHVSVEPFVLTGTASETARLALETIRNIESELA